MKKVEEPTPQVKPEDLKQQTKPPHSISPSPQTQPQEPAPQKGRILTRKKPYRVSKLLREMQEMEDMMDEMRGKMNRYKQKKY